MFNKHKFHVLKNSFSIEEYRKVDFKNFSCLVMDTESCTRKENDYTGAKVYGWGLGALYSDHMIYGETLDEMLSTFKNLFESNYNILKPSVKKNRKTKKYPSIIYVKLPVAIHNLKWDMEFFKYALGELGYCYKKAEIQTLVGGSQLEQKAVVVQEEKTFHIVQNNGVVYGAEIFLPTSFQKKNKDGSKTDIGLCLDFFDFAKIVVDKVENFPKYLNKGSVDSMFYKMKEQYDYSKFREDGHKQSMLELRYQYNDIYMLRKVIEEYYINTLLEGEIDKINKFRTQSSIAFDKLKQKTFAYAGEDYNKEYRNYFELDFRTSFEKTRKRIEKESYKGGFTHVSSLYLNRDIRRRGCSLDINSSYPHKMDAELLPYGRPKKGDYGVIPIINKEEQVYLVECGFDFVKPKSKKSELEVFKIGADNIKNLSPIVGNVSGQEYFYTNIKDDKVIDVYQEVKGSRLECNYKMVITSAEYEFLVENFDFGCYERDGWDILDTDELEFKGMEIGEVLIYKAERHKMRPFVEYYTKQKIYNKKIGNSSLTQSAKTILNSSYGKFGTKTEKEEKDLVFNPKQNIYQWQKQEDGKYEGKEYYYPMASFITSYGRLMLWKAIVYCIGVENFIYCDTDSIYCFLPKNIAIKRMKKYGFLIHPYILGGWDVESSFDRFKAIGQKKYMYHSIDYKKSKNTCKGNQIRCCGLPKEAQEEIAKQGFNEFYLGKEVDGKKARVCVYGGCLLLDVKFKLNAIAW